MSEPTTFPENWVLTQEFDPNDHLIKIERFDKRTQRKVTTDYLNVQNRLLWFIRDQRAMIAGGLAKVPYTIQTELIELDRSQGWAHFKTYLRDVLGNETTMYGSESVHDFPDYIEKASTKSLGRALLLLGYGTAFTTEMDEGERVVDAPLERPRMASNSAPRPMTPAPYQEPAPQPTPRAFAPTEAPRPAPVASNSGAMLANERQVASIRKLCAALHRTEPDFETLTFSEARELLTELSRAYSEARRAG